MIEEDFHAERRVTDTENEVIVFVAGYPRSVEGEWSSNRVWFCKVTKRGLTVEDWHGASKRAALRHARRAWQKAWDKKWFDDHGYPRVIS